MKVWSAPTIGATRLQDAGGGALAPIARIRHSGIARVQCEVNFEVQH
jgi:hypothetical protein